MNQALTHHVLQYSSTNPKSDQESSQTPKLSQPKSMPAPLYAVCYIDKFSDPLRSQSITDALGQKFKLNSKAMFRLASGQPTLVKRATPMKSANALKSLINKLGGCCWVQQLDSSGRFQERRQGSRRMVSDRRDTPRTNIEPDRRGRQNRRQARDHNQASETLILNSNLIQSTNYNDYDPKCDHTFGPKYDRKPVENHTQAPCTAHNKYQDTFSQPHVSRSNPPEQYARNSNLENMHTSIYTDNYLNSQLDNQINNTTNKSTNISGGISNNMPNNQYANNYTDNYGHTLN